jgi:hypothetical protein
LDALVQIALVPLVAVGQAIANGNAVPLESA